jgi:hypothetical protein
MPIFTAGHMRSWMIVLLNFDGLSWLHVTVATLTKVG